MDEMEPGNAAGNPPAAEVALQHVREAERDLAQALCAEARAEHELEHAIEELEAAEHREFWVIVNGRRKEVAKNRLSFAEVVALAFPNPPPGQNIIYTVSYRNGGDKHHPEGTLVAGQSVKIKDGTIFDVTATDKS